MTTTAARLRAGSSMNHNFQSPDPNHRPARRWLPRAVAAVGAFLCAATLVAQSGTVKSNGLPIPGATVTAIKGDQKSVTTTDENGRYDFEGLAPGAYTIEVQMFGFRTERREAATPGQSDWNRQILQ